MGREKKICTSAKPHISQEPYECGNLSWVQIFLVQVTVEKWPQDHYFSQKVLLVGTPNIIKSIILFMNICNKDKRRSKVL